MGENDLASSKKRTFPGARFPIVGIGASAGGLEALTALLGHMDTDTGMAFIIIQHLDPKFPSLSSDILSRVTSMPVAEIEDGMQVLPNHVYVIPSNHSLEIVGERLTLSPRKGDGGPNTAIDHFFESLAKDRGHLGIGVVLSGSAADGTHGLKMIKAADGITFAQEPETAKFESMPKSAIDSGTVDFVLEPKKIAGQLAHIAGQLSLHLVGAEPEHQPDLSRIFSLLKTLTGIDFNLYKQNTIQRRIVRRMMLKQLPSLDKYISLLENNPDELRALSVDIFIHVTSFFRDPEAFEVLAKKILPQILEKHTNGKDIRIWVPGCSTGEEAYSIAMTLVEVLGYQHSNIPIQIFASDLSEASISFARQGLYPTAIEQQVSEARLKRFFVKEPNGYRVSKTIRDICLFSKHDLARDPPFARLDLVSCRNLLIYLSATLQKRILPSFHYTLNQHGILWLGRSETTGGFSNLFEPIDKVNKFFAKLPGSSATRFSFSKNETATERIAQPSLFADGATNAQREADRIVQTHYGPPGVLINDKFEIVQFRGQTTHFLAQRPGQASHHILKMVRPEWLTDFRGALEAARKENTTVIKNDFRLGDESGGFFNIKIIPVKASSVSTEKFYLVLFEERHQLKLAARSKTAAKKKKPTALEEHIGHLEQEIVDLNANNEALIFDFERTQEDLVSINEEGQSANEELQSTNEELETAKEELQSTNEELTTVNDELQIRNVELGQANADLINLLASAEIPVIMIDNDGRIRRFTPKTTNAFNLIATDVGRPIGDINPNFDFSNLKERLAKVVASGHSESWEVLDHKNRWNRVKIRPYRTLDNKIDGAVISLIDIDGLKKKTEALAATIGNLEQERDLREKFVHTLSHDLKTPLTAARLILDINAKIAVNEKVKSGSTDASRHIRRIEAMINDLLDANRIHAGQKLPIHLAHCELLGLVRSVLTELNQTHGERFVLNANDDAIEGNWDAGGLRRALENLCDNAIKYGKANRQITVSLSQDNVSVRMAVHNSGKVLTASEQEHIFRPFSRSKSAQDGSQSGWGIGLTFVRDIAQAHGGDVSVQSTATDGTTFTISIPKKAV